MGINLDVELKKLDVLLEGKQQISTIDVAMVYNLCDKYIKEQLGMDILSIFDKVSSSPFDVTNYILFTLYSESKLFNFLTSNGLNDIIAKTIYSIGDKRVLNITEQVIERSNKRPSQMPIPSDENQIRRIFRALRNNYLMYEKLYKDKVWLINSTSNEGEEIGSARIKISPYMFFHLMGFDYKNILNPNRKDRNGFINDAQAREFAAIFPDSNAAYSLLQNFGNSKNIYELIERLLDSEERFLQAALSGQLSNTVNIDKLELKCYSFERMGAIQSASGIIFFDKEKAIQLGYGSEIQHINTDIILLNDFIRKYGLTNLFGLDFVFSPFDKIKGTQISDQQSIFLTRQNGGGFNSHLFDQQKVSVSSSVAGYRDNDFNFAISEQGSGSDPIGDPIDYRVFDDDERKRIAQTIAEAFPGADLSVINQIIYGSGMKK